MRIAIASSGLGHVARGIETWARDSATALAERGVNVTLFAAGGVRCQVSGVGEGRQVEGSSSFFVSGYGSVQCPNHERRTKNCEPLSTAQHLDVRVLPCLKRSNRLAQRLAAWSPSWAWRWGFTSAYGWEQFSFWWRLWPILRRERFDILHVQDPMVADWCRRFRKMGLVKTKVILAHGTEEPAEFLARFDCVQHLAPWHAAEEAKSKEQRAEGQASDHALGATCGAPRAMRSARSARFCIPNFVDTERFAPSAEGKGQGAEGVGEGAGGRGESDAFVVGTVAAIKRAHKRTDHVIREFEAFLKMKVQGGGSWQSILMIAGAKDQETGDIMDLAKSLPPESVKLLPDLSREAIPALYREMDVLVLGSLFEMMPIAVIEAMASGVPVIVNRHPVLEWMVGEGGSCIDMAAEGALAAEIGIYAANEALRRERGAAARERVKTMFSKEVVVDQMVGMYEEVLRGRGHGAEGSG